jgi:hypothetical protein
MKRTTRKQLSNVLARRHKMREREVMTKLQYSRRISMFWLEDPRTRWAALQRMEKRGKVSVKVIGFPMYRVTIHRK